MAGRRRGSSLSALALFAVMSLSQIASVICVGALPSPGCLSAVGDFNFPYGDGQVVYCSSVKVCTDDGTAYNFTGQFSTAPGGGSKFTAFFNGHAVCSTQDQLILSVNTASCRMTGYPFPPFCASMVDKYSGTFNYGLSREGSVVVASIASYGDAPFTFDFLCPTCGDTIACNETINVYSITKVYGGQVNATDSTVITQNSTNYFDGDTITVTESKVTLQSENLTEVTVNSQESTNNMGDINVLNIYANNLTSEGCGGVGYYVGYTPTNLSLTSDSSAHLLSLSPTPGFSLFTSDWELFLSSFIYTGDDLTKYGFRFCINDPTFYYSNVNGTYVFQLLFEVNGGLPSDSVYSLAYPFTLDGDSSPVVKLGSICVDYTGLINSTDDVDVLYGIAGPTATIIMGPHFATFYAYPLDCAMRPIINNNTFKLNISINGSDIEIRPCTTKTFDPETNTFFWEGEWVCGLEDTDSTKWKKGPNNTYSLEIPGLDSSNGSVTINATTVTTTNITTNSICSPSGQSVQMCSVTVAPPSTEIPAGSSICDIFPMGCTNDGNNHNGNSGGGGNGGGGGGGAGPVPIAFPPLLPPFFPPIIPVVPGGSSGGSSGGSGGSSGGGGLGGPGTGFPPGSGLTPKGGLYIPIVNFTSSMPICYSGVGSASNNGSWIVIDNSTLPNQPYVCLRRNATAWAWTPFTMGTPLEAVLVINGTAYNFVAKPELTIEALPNNTLQWSITDVVIPGYCINCVMRINEKGQVTEFTNGTFTYITPAYVVNTTMQFENSTLGLDANSQIVNLGPTYLGGPAIVNNTLDVLGLVVNGTAFDPSAGMVNSVTGTPNQIDATPTNGDVVLSLPPTMDATGTIVTFAKVIDNSKPFPGTLTLGAWGPGACPGGTTPPSGGFVGSSAGPMYMFVFATGSGTGATCGGSLTGIKTFTFSPGCNTLPACVLTGDLDDPGRMGIFFDSQTSFSLEWSKNAGPPAVATSFSATFICYCV